MRAYYTTENPITSPKTARAAKALAVVAVCAMAFTCLGTATPAHAATKVPKPKAVSVQAGGASFTVNTSWGKKAKPKKVQVRYSVTKSMRDAKTKTYKVKKKAAAAKAMSKTIPAKAGERYYVQVRMKRNGKAGKWSDVQKVTTGYKIVYKLNGGTQAVGQKDYYKSAKKYILKAPTRDGYTFSGWYTNSNFPIGSEVTKIKKGTTGKVKLYAKWTANTYTITYNVNGGTLPSGAKTRYATGSMTYTLPSPTRTGYTFGGWYTDEACTVKAKPITPKTYGNKVYYALWISTSPADEETQGGEVPDEGNEIQVGDISED